MNWPKLGFVLSVVGYLAKFKSWYKDHIELGMCSHSDAQLGQASYEALEALESANSDTQSIIT